MVEVAGGGSGSSVEAQLNRFLLGLMMHESGGQNIPNRGGHSSASGYFQYLNGTWGGYGGYKRAMDAPFSVQWERAKKDALAAWRKYGDWERVAMNHFYPAKAGDPKSTWNQKPPGGGNPNTFRSYVNQVMSKVNDDKIIQQAQQRIPGDRVVGAAIGGDGATGPDLHLEPGHPGREDRSGDVGVPSGAIRQAPAPFGASSEAATSSIGGGTIGVGPDASPEEVRAWVRDNMPQMLWALEHDELGSILDRAAREGLSSERIFGLIFDTDWYQNTAERAREWEFAKSEDPATARQAINNVVASIQAELDRLGIQATVNLHEFADTALSMGWTDQSGSITPMLSRALSEATTQAEAVGNVDALQTRFNQLANNYLVSLSEGTTFDWARKVAFGQASPEAYEQFLADQVRHRMPHLSELVENGALPAMVDAYRQQAGQLLEMAPEELDMSNPKFMRGLDFVDEKGNRRTMTSWEWAQHIRGTDEWRTTEQANDQAATMGEQILQTFGAVR